MTQKVATSREYYNLLRKSALCTNCKESSVSALCDTCKHMKSSYDWRKSVGPSPLALLIELGTGKSVASLNFNHEFWVAMIQDKTIGEFSTLAEAKHEVEFHLKLK